MHPSNPSPEPRLFTHPTPVDVQNAVILAADLEPAAGTEELEEPERWDGLS
jgi:hypothetical protein